MGKKLIFLILILMSLALIGIVQAVDVGSCECKNAWCNSYCGNSSAIKTNSCKNYATAHCIKDMMETSRCDATPSCPMSYFPYTGCVCCIPVGFKCDEDSECCSLLGTRVCSNGRCCPEGKCWDGATSSCGSCTANACTTYGDSTFGDNYCVEKTPSTPNCCGSAGSGVCKACCDNADCAGTICKKCSASYTCVNADADTDPNNNCSVGTWSCVGGTSPNVCVRQRNSGYCSGSGSCASNDEKIPVGGNYVCAGSGDNSFVPVTTSKFCDTTTYNSCGAGGCSGTATTYYHGCTINGCNNITGTCTCTTGEQGPTTTATINAGEDKVFTAGCGNQNATSQALACDVDTNYFCTAGTCSGYYRYSECNGAGTCNANANSYYQQYNVNANAGSSLTAACGKNGASLCNNVWACSSGNGGTYGGGGSFACQAQCNGAGICNYAVNCNNCNNQDGWYDNGDTQWISTGLCTQKQQKQQDYRDYSCSGGSCTYSVTSTRWVDTGVTGNQPDGTICATESGVCEADDTCQAGVCIEIFQPISVPCDAVFRLSPGSGDNNYGAGGDKSCQGFCDGGGVCDYAKNCVPAVICGDGVINNPPETCELPNTNNNANCPQSVENCVGAKLQTRDNRGNCNAACGCAYDGWSALTCVAGKCGAVCSTGASQNCVTAQGYAGTQVCDAATCGWGVCNPSQWCGDNILTIPPEQCDPPGSCQPGLLCNASCKWQATGESIALGNCNDGLDNDCDGEDDWDTSGNSAHGDNGCPVGVTSISGPNTICPGQSFQVRCKRSTPVIVNSISARIDGQSACSFNSWSGAGIGADAVFDCTAPAAAGSYTVRCYVDATKSYVTPPNRTYSLSVGGAGCCAQYTAQGQVICDGDGGCDWCPECSGTLYSGSTSRCVVAGSCTFLCNRNPADLTVPYDYCNAVCDNTDAPCALQTRCTGTIYETNSAVCSPACACNYAGWTRGTCTVSKANCNAACSTGETKACTTADGYPGNQLCNETTCTFGLCTSLLTCGDSILTMPPEQCDPPGLCQPPNNTGIFCNSTCKWQASPLENTFVNGCNDSVDNDCDGVRDGQDNACPEGAGINVASPYRACTDGLPQDSVPPCTDPRCSLGAPYADSDDFKCGDFCKGVNATTGQLLVYDNETSPFNKNYFNQSIGITFTDWEAYNGLRKMFCCGDDAGEWYENSTMNLNPGDDSFNKHACCNASSHCIDGNGNCQLGLEENFELCLDGLDNDCDGKIDIEDTRCGGNVAGFVFNDAGSPVPGASVKSSPPGLGSSFENSTITNATGQYMFRALVGNYTFIAKKEGYDDNAILVNVSPDGVKANFTLRNGSCHADCTDYYGNCNPDCEGLSFVNSSGQLETCTFISDLCYDRPKDFRATYKDATTNITTEYTCCKGPERTYKTLKATVTGNMTDLYDYVVNVKFMGRQAKLHILTWNSEE